MLNAIRLKSYGTGHRDEDTAIERMKKVNLGIVRMLHPDKHREVPSLDRQIATEATALHCNVYPEVKARFCASVGCEAPIEKPLPEWDGPAPPEDPPFDDFPPPPEYWGNWGREWYGAYDGLTESQREARQSLEKKWIFIPGYDIILAISSFKYKGWESPQLYLWKLPELSPLALSSELDLGVQSSWRQALEQAVDSMANLYLGSGHTNVKGLSVEMLAATLDSLRDKLCPNAPSSRAYTHQCPDYHTIPPGSSGHRAPRVGWRQTLQHESALLDQVVFVCGGSGSLKYKHKSRKCMTASLKQVAGWKISTPVSTLGAGHVTGSRSCGSLGSTTSSS